MAVWKTNVLFRADIRVIIYQDVWFSSLVLKTNRLTVLKHWTNCLWFSRQPVISKNKLENQKACLENQKVDIVNCTGKFVFDFQDNLCSQGLLEIQI